MSGCIDNNQYQIIVIPWRQVFPQYVVAIRLDVGEDMRSTEEELLPRLRLVVIDPYSHSFVRLID